MAGSSTTSFEQLVAVLVKPQVNVFSIRSLSLNDELGRDRRSSVAVNSFG